MAPAGSGGCRKGANLVVRNGSGVRPSSGAASSKVRTGGAVLHVLPSANVSALGDERTPGLSMAPAWVFLLLHGAKAIAQPALQSGRA